MNKLIKDAVAFYRTRAEWIGDGGEPLPQDKAQARADRCLHGNGGKPCPHNQEMPLFEVLTGAVAKSVIAQLKVKDKMGLRLQQENELHTCDVCLCSLRLKCFVPSKFIHVSFGREELPSYCWMNELFETQNSNDNKIDGLRK